MYAFDELRKVAEVVVVDVEERKTLARHLHKYYIADDIHMRAVLHFRANMISRHFFMYIQRWFLANVIKIARDIVVRGDAESNMSQSSA